MLKLKDLNFEAILENLSRSFILRIYTRFITFVKKLVKNTFNCLANLLFSPRTETNDIFYFFSFRNVQLVDIRKLSSQKNGLTNEKIGI